MHIITEHTPIHPLRPFLSAHPSLSHMKVTGVGEILHSHNSSQLTLTGENRLLAHKLCYCSLPIPPIYTYTAPTNTK